MCPWNCFLNAFLFLSTVQCLQAASLKCYKGSMDSYVETPLDFPEALTDTTISDCIDPTLPSVFYTFGYRGKESGPATTTVIKGFLATKKRNVILLDWEKEASSGILGFQLGYVLNAVPNAKKVGIEMGIALVRMTKGGLNMTDVHLIGHSLGAHVMAHAGRVSRKKGYTVPRITGLDPAKTLFEAPFALQKGIDRTCAKFVDIIHTDPGGYGISKPAGTVDIWPNYAGGESTQPGCPAGKFEQFSADDLCSHDRCWRFYTESLFNQTAFIAVYADSYANWKAGLYRTDDSVYMGELTSTVARGNYFLTTNSIPPFGRGVLGVKPEINPARRRRRSSPLKRLLNLLR